MATWTGWAAQFLSAAGLPNTAGNRQWLDDWSTNSISGCRNNPIDLSATGPGSSNCKKLTGSRTAQNYPTHAAAAAAFNKQLHSGNFPRLLASMRSGGFPSPSELGAIETELLTWGSLNLVSYLEKTFGVGPGGGGITGGHVYNPTSPKAWGAVQKSVNRGLPTFLRRVNALNKSTSTALRRRRRVGR